MSRADLDRLNDDWARAEYMERLALGKLTEATPCEDGTQAGTDAPIDIDQN
jgi:hypothetical protein